MMTTPARTPDPAPGVRQTAGDTDGFVPLFDGATLAGWHSVPRVYGTAYPGGPRIDDLMREYGVSTPPHPEKHPARWSARDGELVGEQAVPGYGGYLVTDDSFGDFELVLEMRPDWPADTGVMVRRRRDSWDGFQILVDHRESGSIGGFYGNGLAGFSAVPFALASRRDAEGTVVGLTADDPATSAEPVTPDKIDRLSHAAGVEDFLSVWRFGDWNELRIRCVGALPTLTTWVNGLKVAELDTARLRSPGYDPGAVLDLLGPRGHIALEVHDNDSHFGEARWGVGAVCRWRNIRIKNLDTQKANRP
jgi:hypothetical protein